MKLLKERARREPHRNFFSHRVVMPWNALPEKVVSSNTTQQFKIEYDKCGGGGLKICSPFYPERSHTMCEAIQVNSGKHCTRCLAMGSKLYGFKAPDAEMIILF